MSMTRRMALKAAAAAAFGLSATRLRAEEAADGGGEMLRQWYHLVLLLVRHTATYSPPVASRSFAYLGIAAYQAVASGSTSLVSLEGQINGLRGLPVRNPGKTYNDALITHCVIASAVKAFFSNTGPTGQRAMAAAEKKLKAQAMAGLPQPVIDDSLAYGEALTAAILDWSKSDGGAVVENMGFPMHYDLTPGPAHWVPTSPIRQQQFPLLPGWGKNRTFAMPDGAACAVPPPPAYSEEKDSTFYREALEVYETGKHLTPEQQAIARFWSDDPMLSPTPPGHWMSIGLQVLAQEKASLDKTAEVMMRLGVAMADSFIGCWNAKFQYDLVRPVTYIKRVIDPKWEPMLITPPFPEYPSGHSVESGAAQVVLTSIYGENFAFSDGTHMRDGIPARQFASFKAAAEEAGISRLYGGIHFRAAIVEGLEQGACIGQHAVALRTRSST
ncbi:vanadium-dependent haloperoxidase [Aestuariivirga sp.]|uniref:vanadium-dependent haloperoxidase n=1 Tax=Aestuariivirga sp. TaxID=2650926 RepID=UPI003BA860EA